MNWNAYLKRFFAVDHHRLDAFGNHRFSDVLAAGAGDFYFLAAGNSHLVSKLRGHFDERFRHELHIHRIVLRPIVIVLSQSIGCADHVESLGRCSELIQVGFEFLRDGIVGLIRMQWIRDRTLDRFVMLRERSIGKRGQGCEDAADAFGVHDEGAHVIRRLRIGFEIGDIVTDPFLLGFVPPDLPAFHIPRLARWIAGGAVVHHTAIGRPGPRPVLIDSQARRIVRATSLHLRPGFSPGT